MSVHYTDATVTLHHGDCLDILAELPDSSVDSVVTDPPYGLEFMGKAWDSFGKDTGNGYREAPRINDRSGEGFPGHRATAVNSFQAGPPFQRWCEAWATECLRVLKPGGHLLAFGGTRTWHRLACAVEDAGFEVRDSIAWLYGSGFPKSLDVSKAIDKAAGAEPEVIGKRNRDLNWRGVEDPDSDRYSATRANLPSGSEQGHVSERPRMVPITAPATEGARIWQGWGTALKPAFEPIVVARKPLTGTVAGNVLAHGTGALNIDACRIEGAKPDTTRGASVNASSMAAPLGGQGRILDDGRGRWPANVVLDEGQAAALDQQSGESTAGSGPFMRRASLNQQSDVNIAGRSDEVAGVGHGDTGGASRFFYTAKADATERIRINGTAHPTVKPLALMRWLVRLVTPDGGTVLEPFAGSGTTVEACILEGFRCIAIERETDYLPLIVQRINRRRDPVAAVRATGDDGGLFDLLEGEPA